MSTEEQITTIIEPAELPVKAAEMMKRQARLVQIGCTNMDKNLEVNYSFDENYKFTNFRIVIPMSGTVVPSLSSIYFAAAIYENELKDLFGIQFSGLILDYKGEFYKKSVETPFNPKQN